MCFNNLLTIHLPATSETFEHCSRRRTISPTHEERQVSTQVGRPCTSMIITTTADELTTNINLAE